MRSEIGASASQRPNGSGAAVLLAATIGRRPCSGSLPPGRWAEHRDPAHCCFKQKGTRSTLLARQPPRAKSSGESAAPGRAQRRPAYDCCFSIQAAVSWPCYPR